MSNWGKAWGQQWGCVGQSLADICEAWVWWQFHDKPNMNLLVCEVMVRLFSSLDEKLRIIAQNRGIDGANGGEVDAWGAMLDEKRNGMSDDLYKIAIKAKARAIISDGQIDDLADMAAIIAPTRTITFQEMYPACIQVFISGAPTEDEIMLLLRLMILAVGRGICIGFIEVDSDGVFEWSYRNPDDSFDPVDFHWGHTDGDIDPTTTAGFAVRL